MKTMVKWHTFDCFIIKQTSGPEIAVMVFDAYTLRDLATVSRLADEEQGYQRIINNRKLAAIKRYVESPGAVLPTGIVLATGDKAGYIVIEDRKAINGSDKMWAAKIKVKQAGDYKPFLVIDGQHRLFGITSSKLSPYPVPATVLLDAPKIVQMANFEVINNKATRIQSAHLNELRALMFDITPSDTTDLNDLLGQLGAKNLSSSSLVSELNGSGMVFEGILDFPSNQKAGFVSSTTLVQCIERSREGGFLHYFAEEDDDHLTAYNSLWHGIRLKFLKRWKFEVELFDQFSRGKLNKAEARRGQCLLHSASIAVLGQIADKELASATFRPRWMDDPNQIASLVENEIFAAISEKMWDDKDLQIDNTSKGRQALKSHIEKQMISQTVRK